MRRGKAKVDGTKQAQTTPATVSGGAKLPANDMAALDDRTDAGAGVFLDSSEDSDDGAECKPPPVFLDSSESSSEDDNDEEKDNQDEDAWGSPVVHNSDAVCTGTLEDPTPGEDSDAEKILKYYELHGCLPDIVAPP